MPRYRRITTDGCLNKCKNMDLFSYYWILYNPPPWSLHMIISCGKESSKSVMFADIRKQAIYRKNSCKHRYLWKFHIQLEFYSNLPFLQASLLAQLVKNLPAMQEAPVQYLGQENPLEKRKATHSSILELPLWLSW